MIQGIKKTEKNLCWQTLILAVICAIVTVGLVVWRNGGIFTYYGDYNCQQIAFYMHTHEFVTNGQIGWDWNTDLGSSLIGAYSFYLIFSPFFWLTLPFETAMVPYLMAPLFVIKFATCAVTAYFYVARFVKDKRFAVIGGLLYAFSGYCIYNLFFNHFLDVVAFFPLILIGLEMLITEDKHGPFAVAVALNAIVNYWFFIGEVFFVILYFFIRITDKNITHKFRRFLFVAAESVLGLGIAAAAVLPSVLAITANPRTGVDNFINGWNLWLYYSEQRVPAIIASFFFPPDMPSKQNMFTGQGAQWASMAGWLPLFGMTGVIAYVRSVKNDWLKKMIIACCVCALVPVLNAVFILFNHSFYARWYYMFILMLVLATAKALESSYDGGENAVDMKKGLIPSFCIIVGLILILTLTPVHYDDGNWELGLLYEGSWFLLSATFAVVCVFLATLLWFLQRKKFYMNLLVLTTAVICALYGFAYINLGYSFAGDHQEIIDDAVGLSEEMELPETKSFARADFYECFENMGLYWNIPSIRCFHSVVTPSIMDFYPTVGVTRDVSSKPDYEYYELRALLSVKYLYSDADETIPESNIVQGFNYYTTENGYHIFQNENYIPMGFTFDQYVTEEEYYSVYEAQRSELLISSIVLTNEQAQLYGSYIDHNDNLFESINLSYADFQDEVRERSRSSAYRFEYDHNGFTAKIHLSESNLVFFSVPYESGWKAYVNGVETAIEKVDIGFMAVFAEKGINEIVFVYDTPGLKIGAVISVISAAALIAYIVFFHFEQRRKAADGELINEYYSTHNAAVEAELSPEEDLTIVRSPEEVPPYSEYNGPEEKIYPEL
ncbi:MAG: YfhO family protein [Oscillospiraceae bacterium]|nr:YfhO family protein [Oscillospiraceae bacterium]